MAFLTDFVDWAQRVALAEDREEEFNRIPFSALAAYPKWQELAMADGDVHKVNLIFACPNTTLACVVDALQQDLELHPEHGNLRLAFDASLQENAMVEGAFLILQRWDDPNAFACALSNKFVSEPSLPANIFVCLPRCAFQSIKQDFTSLKHPITSRLVPQLVKNAQRNDLLISACAEWLVSLCYWDALQRQRLESAPPRMLKPVVLLSSALAKDGLLTQSQSLLRYCLDQNAQRFPGAHKFVRSALLQSLANLHENEPREQIKCYEESIAIDVAELKGDALSVRQIANTCRVLADIFHAEMDLERELGVINTLCNDVHSRFPLFPSEYTQDLRRAGLLCQILLRRSRKLHQPKRCLLLKRSSAPPPDNERKLLLCGIGAFEKMLQLNRSADVPLQQRFLVDFRLEFTFLAEMYADLEDFDNAERMYQEIFSKVLPAVAAMQQQQQHQDLDECALLCRFADVLKKKNEFVRAVLLIERAFEIQTRKNFGTALCQENANHLTRLELVYESARFNLQLLLGDLEALLVHLINSRGTRAESSGSGNDIHSKLWEDFSDEEEEEEEAFVLPPAGDFLDNMDQILARFPNNATVVWPNNLNEVEVLECSLEDEVVQSCVRAINRARLLQAFNIFMRDESQRKSMSFTKTLYHRAMLEKRMSTLLPRFNAAVAQGDHVTVVDLSSDLAATCKQLGLPDQALFARNAGLNSRLVLNERVDVAFIHEMDEIAVEYFNHRMFADAVRVFTLVVQFAEELNLYSVRIKALCNKAKTLECQNRVQEAAQLYSACSTLFPLDSPERLIVLRALFECLVIILTTLESNDVEQRLDDITNCAMQILPLLRAQQQQQAVECVTFLIRLGQLFLQFDDVGRAELYCEEAARLAEPRTMAMYWVMEMRIATSRLKDDWDLAQQYCDEAREILLLLVQTEREVHHFYGTVQIPLWLERAEMLEFGCAKAFEILDQVVQRCDAAIQFAKQHNELGVDFAVLFCEHRGDAYFCKEALDQAYASYQLGFLYSGGESHVLQEKMDRVRDAMEDPGTSDSKYSRGDVEEEEEEEAEEEEVEFVRPPVKQAESSRQGKREWNDRG